MSAYQPMKITLHMQGPWVESDQPMHLDDLLAAMRVAKEEEVQGEGFNPRQYNHDLPLERHEVASGDWVFKASMLIAGDRLKRISWMQTGGIDLEVAAQHRAYGYLSLRADRVVTAGGPFKRQLFHLPITYSTHLYGYAVGDIEAVRELLGRCKAVGARRSTGFGVVDSITVEPVDADQCAWQHRHLPVDGVKPKGYALAYGGLVPPYWDRVLHSTIYKPLDRDNPTM